MTYVICEPCIDVKDTACVDVCPVDCIHPTPDNEEFFEEEVQLYIDPEECIDCGVCEPECPINAIEPDTNEEATKWVELNEKYSNLWPNITKKRADDVPQDQEKWRGVTDKIKHFSEKAGRGD